MVKKLAILALAALAGAACMREPAGGQEEGSGGPVVSLFQLSAQPMAEIEVRSADDQINDLWVVQCVDSVVTHATYFATVDPTKVEVELDNSTGNVYFIANAVNTANLYTVGQHERDVVAASGAVITTTNAGMTVFPLAGKWSGTPVSGAIPGATVKLYRSYARINLSLGASLPKGHSLTFTSDVRLYMPKTVQYYRDPKTLETQGIYPPNATLAYYSMAPNGTVLATPEQIQATGYSPEIYRGKGTATQQTDKDDKLHGPNGGMYLSYIQINGKYVENGATFSVSYKVFLGANNTDDYNVLRNNSYNVTITIRGRNSADIRITKSDIIDHIGDVTDFFDYAENNTTQWFLSQGKGEDDFNSGNWDVVAPGFDFSTNKGSGTGTDGSACPEGWRLPTLDEIRLLYVYSLDSKGNSVLQYDYWSSTWSGTAASPKVYYCSGVGEIGTIDVKTSTITRNYRCVRDMPVAQSVKYPYVAENPPRIVSRDGSQGVLPTYLLNLQQNDRMMGAATQPDYDYVDTLDRPVPQLRVAKADCAGTFNFSEAYQACKEYSESDSPAGSWRLPTERELHLMFVCADDLASVSGFTALKTDDDYVSGAKRIIGGTEWVSVGKFSCVSDNNLTSVRHSVRCVRAVHTSYPYFEGNYLISKDVGGGLDDSQLLTDDQKAWLLSLDPYTTPIDDRSVYNKVGARLRIAGKDCNAGNTPGVTPTKDATATAAAQYTYNQAYAACHAYSETGAPAGTWRLPTQAEAYQIEKANSSQVFDFSLMGSRVSCVRSRGDYSFVWLFNPNSTTKQITVVALPVASLTGGAMTKFSFRCVRDE